MKVLIIEDEPIAANRLVDLLKKYDEKIEISAKISSVKKSVKWFNENVEPDLVFMDIQLADGLSFDIFEQIKINCPIIFTTAYDEYAIKAFKVNSVDYLLKPIDFSELTYSIEKYKTNFNVKSDDASIQYSHIEEVINNLTNKYKDRFVVKVGLYIKPIETSNIVYFYSMEKATYIHTNDKRNYVIDFSLEQIEKLVNPKMFFRINRKYIININAIDDIVSFSKSRMKINLQDSDVEDFIVSREKVNKFKNWLG